MILSTLRNRWRDLIEGFWFIPGLVFFIGPLLALLLVNIDRRIAYPPSLYGLLDSPSAMRDVLSTMSGALISITALVFSITLITLQLVSSQFTPRALRGLLSDRLNQFIAGSLVGIFAYCQLVLVNIRDATPHHQDFVPILGVSTGFLLAFVGLILLLVFISHTVSSIQIANIAGRISRQTMRALEHPYPELATGENAQKDGRELVEQWRARVVPECIAARRAGYIQTIAIERLRRLVTQQQLCLYLRSYPGQFVTTRSIIAEVWFTKTSSHGHVTTQIQRCLSIANERDLQQDAAFGARQLADIALRALSPAINDPTTAVLCIDYLCALIEHVAYQPHLRAATPLRLGNLVMECRPIHEYPELLLEIGRYATSNARVVRRLLRSLRRIAEAVKRTERHDLQMFLKTFAQSIASAASEEACTELDRTLITHQLEQTLEEIEGEHI